jgi:tetratricopeptide (TPR) repeat protein
MDRHLRPALLLSLVALPSAPLPAEPVQEPEAQGEALAAADGEDLLARGEYSRALSVFERVLEGNAEDRAARMGMARALEAVGRHEDVLAALEGVPEDLDVLALRAEANASLGRYEEAERNYRTALEREDATAVLQVDLAALLQEMGRREEALDLYRAVARHATEDLVEDARGLWALGRAYAALGRLSEASEVLVEATQADPDFPAPYVTLGDLYFRVYRDSEGTPSPVPEYREALERNPRFVPALVGSHRVYRSNFQRDAAAGRDVLEKALATNPRSVEALVESAIVSARDRDFEGAKAALERALRVNPRHRGARAWRAALDVAEDRLAAFREEEARWTAENPASGSLHAAAGSLLVELYRFPEAIPYLEEATRREPTDDLAWTDLGRALANAGREEEAVARLRRAEEVARGFVHPWRHNMLLLLDRMLRTFERVAAEPFEIRIHPDEAAVLREYVPALLGEAFEVLGDRYGYRPQERVFVECFDRFGDFSVRTIGFTGFGALGACFGPVVTQVSPLAPEVRGQFSWTATLWHEYAHVLTLGLSRGRVPRWLTEGLSTLEEKRLDPAFDRGMELELLNARASGSVFPLGRLNEAFRGPRILFGYYQGGLLCEFLSEEHPFDALLGMLRDYAKGRSTEDIVRDRFGMSLEELDRRFLEFVDRRLADVRVEPARDPEGLRRLAALVRRDPVDLDAAVSLAWEAMRRRNLVDAEEGLRKVRASDPDHARAHLLAAEIARMRGRTDVARREYEAGFAAGAEEFFARAHYAKLLEEAEEFDAAVEAWRAAKRAYPRFVEPAEWSPHLALHRLLSGEGKADEALAELEAYAGLNGRALRPPLDLAAAAERWLARANGIDPFRRGLHRSWARVLRAAGKLPEALRELRVARTVRAEQRSDRERGEGEEEDARERAEIFREEAEVFLLLGDPKGAEGAARQALELDPSDEGQQLLERVRRASSG